LLWRGKGMRGLRNTQISQSEDESQNRKKKKADARHGHFFYAQGHFTVN
jgi:hypothetical protein